MYTQWERVLMNVKEMIEWVLIAFWIFVVIPLLASGIKVAC